LNVQQQLPSTPTLEAFSAANQVGTAQLAVEYCNTMVTTPSLAAQVLPGVNFSNTSLFSTPGGVNSVTSALAARVLGIGSYTLSSQPAASTITTELGNLIGILCSTSACNNTTRNMAVTSAACAAAFGSADMAIY
jgi:hypothetical protein